jgi:hypothetical protein
MRDPSLALGMTHKRREYGDHFLGGMRCPQRVGGEAFLSNICAFGDSFAIVFGRSRSTFPRFLEKTSRGIAPSNV